MRRIVTALATTVTALVLLFSYHTSTNSGGLAASSAISSASPGATSPSTTSPSTTSPSTTTSEGTTSDTTTSDGTSDGTSDDAAATSSSQTFTGDTAQTRWGDVQVEITVSGGKITASRTVVVPDGNQRDVEINDVAVPILNNEVVDQQSADIDTVSGATVTSDGYIESLQSAIDKAGL